MGFVFGIAALVIGYGVAYSGVSMLSADANNPGVGLFQAFGVDNVVGFDLSHIDDATSNPSPDNVVPTTTGQTPQTGATPRPTFTTAPGMVNV